MKSPPLLRIHKMRVRVPGTSKQEGYALVQQLSERLGELPLGSTPEHLGAMRLRIQSESAAHTALSNSIAAAIRSKLGRNQHSSHA